MSLNEEPGLNEPPGGPSSLESEYDEYLALSDVDIGSPSGPNEDKLDHPEEGGFKDSLPFKNVLASPIKYKASHRRVFIPNQEIELQITGYERNVTTHLLSPNLYTIELKHGEFRWTLRKRYKHIQHLHQQLKLFRTSLNIPFPTKSHRERRTSFKNTINKSKADKQSRALPRFPSKPEALVPDEQIGHRMKQLEQYLQNLLKVNLYRNHYETAYFLEVSELSFVSELGGKGKEGLVQKRTRSAHPGGNGCNCCGFCDGGFCVRCNYVCGDICGSWRTRWLVVKDSFIAYIRPKDGRVKSVILFDSGFEVSSGIFSTGLRNGLHIINSSRQIIIKCPTRRTSQEWQANIKEVVHREGGDFTQRNRYYSFTPVRERIQAGWFVDGSGYMAAVAAALEQAKEEIYIADWWLSPEIHMKRPAIEGDYWQLDKILERKAVQGVKVFVLLYKEVEMALGINSYYSKQRLVSKNDNIKVLRHPDHAKAGVFLWAHHEKLVVVDQSIAFLGGIDLCYGRWDDFRHRLTDLGSSMRMSREDSSIMNGLTDLSLDNDVLLDSTRANDECNGTLLTNGDELTMMPSPENIKCNTPESERKSLFSAVRGRGKEFLHMLSFSSQDEDELDAMPEEKNDDIKRVEDAQSNGTQETNVILDETIAKTNESALVGSAKLWIGKDYTNFILQDFQNLDRPYQDLVDRNSTPRMPWHDIGAVVYGSAARDLARHFIQRWNAAKIEKAKVNLQYPFLLPKTYKEFKSNIVIPDLNSYNVTCQVVRSVSHWSAGFLDVDAWEGSIHEAYVDAIAKSRHYVYIENQFFISLASLQVRNQVADAIYKRIVRAHKEGTVFRVYIVLPLLPGFEGEVGTPSGTALHAITHWNYASICRGDESLLARLKKAGIKDPTEYVTFHGLRTHSILNGAPITELIYVHSKLLIVDDRLVICGSANINDRSLLGRRDSELAVVIEDEEFKEGVMNGEIVYGGKYCGSLRRYLFREHLGVLENPTENKIDVKDPISSSFYHDVWRSIAHKNTEIYEKVFNCIPSNEARCFASLKRYTSETPLVTYNKEEASALLSEVKGHLVMLPLDFLRNETLTPNASSVTGMMPTSLWT